MCTETNIFSFVFTNLRQTKYGNLTKVAISAGVPESTIKKIRSGEVKNPRIQTVQALYDYFQQQPHNLAD